jgi:hypothetical protein
VPTSQGVGSATIFRVYIIHPSLNSYSQNEEVASLFEASVTPYQPTCPHVPEDLNIVLHTSFCIVFFMVYPFISPQQHCSSGENDFFPHTIPQKSCHFPPNFANLKYCYGWAYETKLHILDATCALGSLQECFV